MRLAWHGKRFLIVDSMATRRLPRGGRAGGRLVVPIVDVARAALGLPPAHAADPQKILQGKKGAAASAEARRRGRPRREEEEQAARRGLTVKELRARQGAKEGGAQ
jgi:hypothetical protein